jgi:hypothetical protein
LSGRLAALFKRLTQGVYIVGSLDRQPSGAKLVSSRLLQAAWPRLSWEAMPHSSLRCTLAVRCRSVEKSRGVRGQMPGHRQFANPPIEEAPLRPRQTSYGLGYNREPSRLKGNRGLMSSTSTSSRVQDKYRVGCRTQRKTRKQKSRQQKESGSKRRIVVPRPSKCQAPWRCMPLLGTFSVE